MVALCAVGFIHMIGIRLAAFKSSPVLLICRLHQFSVMVPKIDFGHNKRFFTSCTHPKLLISTRQSMIHEFKYSNYMFFDVPIGWPSQIGLKLLF